MLISQYVAAVRSYSSEYGAARSCSNVVTNIIGAPAVPFELLDHHNSTAFRLEQFLFGEHPFYLENEFTS